MMDDLLIEVNTSIFMEYGRASQIYGPANNSSHESYGVIKEEYEEAMEATEVFREAFDAFWDAVKKDDYATQNALLPFMQQMAHEAASEWIQSAAMCYKATILKEATT